MSTTDQGLEASIRMEQLYAERVQQLEYAAEYEARGWTHCATLARRRAAGKLAALNAIARRMGWMD